MITSNTIAAFLIGVLLTSIVFVVLQRRGPNLPTWSYGTFIGEVNPTWLDDGRMMQLNQDFAYQDPDGKVWLAPAGSAIDGASIPRALWTIVGGPFEGKYRNASVIHDVACEEKTQPSSEVHRMFYFACRCGGVSESKSKLMYYAVSNFGPQWKIAYEVRMHDEKPVQTSRPVEITEPRQMTVEEVEAAMRYFESHNPSLDEIRSLGPISSQQ